MAGYYVDKNGNITKNNTNTGQNTGSNKKKKYHYFVDSNGNITKTEYTDLEYKAEEKAKKKQNSSWFKSGAFKDGYQFGDIFKTVTSSVVDAGLGIVKGAGNLGEGIVDLGMHGVAGLTDLVGFDSFADDVRDIANYEAVDNATKGIEGFFDENSVLGNKMDSVAEGLGYVGGMVVTGGIGGTALSSATTFASGMGSGISEAYNSGASDAEAWAYGALSGTIEAGTEMLFGGLGKGVKALGISHGISSLDDVFAKNLSKKLAGKITNEAAQRYVSNVIQYGVKASAEGFEEVLSGAFSAAAKDLTYMNGENEESLWKLIQDEDLLTQFAVGAATSGIAQAGGFVKANKTKTDFITGNTKSEEAVVKAVAEKRIAESEQNGAKLTKKQKNEIYEQVNEALDRGELSTDDIEEALAGDSYKAYKDILDKENALREEIKGIKENKFLSKKQKHNKIRSIKKKLNAFVKESNKADVKNQLDNAMSEIFKNDTTFNKNGKIVRGSKLLNSYDQRAKRGQYFDADVTKYDEKHRAIVQKAIDSKVLNNTRRTHELVDMIAKLSADKGIDFDFTNNENLKNSSFAVKGATVNGYFDRKNKTIGVNADSAKSLDFVVGHEITHVLEGTEVYDKLQEAVFAYAKTKKDYDNRVKALKELYNEDEIDYELTADLVGDYLFADEDFIRHLSTTDRNVSQKIFDEIKYLCKIATAGSKEARQLEKVKRLFEKAYREGGKNSTEASIDGDVGGVKLSLTDKSAVARETFGTTSRFTEAGFIQADGQMLKLGQSGMSGVNHKRIESIYEDAKGDKAVLQFLEEGNVRIIASAPGIELSAGKQPTISQLNTISRFISDSRRTKSSFYMDFTDSNGKTVESMNYDAPFDTELIMYDIKDYYRNGKIKYSISKQTDTDYLSAVERGDTETAQKMVKDIAKESGYDTPLLYHGTGNFGFTQFRDGGIYATKSQGVAMGYNRGQGLGRVRSASKQYIPNDGTAETTIKNAENILGAKLTKVTENVRSNILSKSNKTFAEISDKISEIDDGINQQEFEKFWEYITDKYGEDKAIEYTNAYQGLAYMFTDGVTAEEMIESENARQWFRSDMEHSGERKRLVSDLYSEEYDRIKGTTFQPLFRYLTGYDFGDALIDIEYGLLRLSDNQEKLVNQNGSLVYLDDIIDAVEQQKNVGIYQLYGKVGDNPLVIDEGKVFWDSIPFQGKHHSTDYIVKWAKDNGYTSVLFKNVLDPSSGGSANVYADEYVFFDSEQVKSADPVTYDDNGNVIPLSERFKETNKDIRYSITKDSEGHDLTKEQSEYFKKAKTTDTDGRLVALYHGSRNSVFTEFNTEQGVWLTDDSKYADVYATAWHTWRDDLDTAPMQDRSLEKEVYDDADLRIYKVYANITNPVNVGEIDGVVDDDFVDRLISVLQEGTRDQGQENLSYIEEDIRGALEEWYGYPAYNFTRSEEFLDYAREQGFDGIKATESGRNTWCAFDASNQVKLTTNKKPTSDPDIRYSLSTENTPMEKPKDSFGFDPTKANLQKDLKTVRAVRTETMLKNGYNAEDVEEVNHFMDNLATFMEKAGVTYKFIGLKDVNNAKLKVTYDKNGNPKKITMSAMVKNGEYPVNFDFTRICKKRESMSMVIKELAKRKTADGKRTIDTINLDAKALWTINEELRNAGLETACLGCFVESKRYNIQAFADKAVKMWNTIVDEVRQENGAVGEAASFNFAEGINLDRVDYGAIEKIFADYNTVKGRTSPEARMRALIRNGGELYQRYLHPSDLMTPEGIEAIKAMSTKKNDFYGILKGVYGQAAPKEVAGFSPYNSEVALLPKKKNGKALSEYIASIGGVRMQSFSDFLVANTYDYMQMVADLSARHLPAHAYTKEIAFAKIFGMTGIKINMSVMFDIDANLPDEYAGLQFVADENGDDTYHGVKGYWDYLVGDKKRSDAVYEASGERPYVQSIGFDEAVALQNDPRYSKNCGIIGVGMSDRHIFKMLGDDRIRYIIPYHSSSLPAVIAEVTNIKKATDYTNSQNTRRIVSITDANGKAIDIKSLRKHCNSWAEVYSMLQENVALAGWEVQTESDDKLAGRGGFDIYKDVEATKNPKKSAENYLQYCAENNYMPVFEQFAFHENYYKLLYDFDPYDTVTGEYSPQTEVKNIYSGYNPSEGLTSTETIEKIIDSEMAKQNEINKSRNEVMPSVVDNVLDQLGVEGNNVGFSLSKEGETQSQGRYLGKDIRFEPSDIAPMQNTESVAPKPTEAYRSLPKPTEDIAPTAHEAIEPMPEQGEEAEWAKNKMTRVETADKESKGKRRKWTKTSVESDAVDGRVLFSDLDAEKVRYQPISNKVTLNNANAKLGNLGYEQSVNYFNAKFADKSVGLDDIVLGERLIQEALNRGDNKTAGELIQNVAILGTELGQKVQALSIIKRLTPEGQLGMLRKIIERGKTKGDKAYEGVELTQDMIDHILNTYGKDGTFDQAELNKAVEDVKQKIADKMKVTKMDKVNAWRYLSMLGNPKTHIRNLVSNVAMRGTVAVKNAVARTIEGIAPIKNRTRTWEASSEAVTKFAEKTTAEMKDILIDGDKYSEDASIKAKRTTFKNKILNGVYEFNSDLLSKEDWWFSKPAFTNSLKEYLTANGIKTEADIKNNPEIVERAKQYAVEQSQIATFRQYSWLANKIGEIERKNTATSMAVGAVLPFKKTPINIAKTGLSYSPLGFMKTLTYDISKVKQGQMDASTLVDHLSQNITGSAVMLVGYLLASAGFLNGGGEDDKEGQYDYQLGKQSYSINIGGSTYSLSWLSPISMPLFVGANAYEQLVEGKEWNGDVVVETLAQTLDPLSEMSFLSSLDDVLSSYDSGVQKFAGIGQTALQSYASQFVPTMSSQFASILDDTKRTTKVSGDSGFKMFDETLNQLKLKIPFLRETLEPSTDIWGNEIKQSENLLARAFESAIAPYSRRENIATAIDAEIKDLYSQTGDSGVIPNIPYNYVKYDDVKYDMSAKEYTEYKKTYGQTANQLLEDLFHTSTYAMADSETRADMVNKVYDYAREVAKKNYFDAKGVEYTNATKGGVEYYKELPIKGAIENDMPVDEYSFFTKNPGKHDFLMANGVTYDEYIGFDEANKDAYDWAYKNPDEYALWKAVTDDVVVYRQYAKEIYDIEADKDSEGKTIRGSRKEKVWNYIFDLDVDYGQKCILFKSEYPADDSYNYDIVDYLNAREDISYEDMEKILTELGFTVKSDGTIEW